MHPAVRMQQGVVRAANASQRTQRAEVAQSVVELRETLRRNLSDPVQSREANIIRGALSHGRHTTEVLPITDQSARSCSDQGLRDLLRDLHRLGVANTPLDDPEEYERHRLGLAPDRRKLVVRARIRYEHTLRDAVRVSLNDSVHRKQTVGEAIGQAHSAVSDREGSVQRIFLTENAAAYNASRQSALRVAARANPHIQQRWTELIDGHGKPLDKRVAQDSFAMHGMVVPVGQPFVIPPDPRIAAVLHGKRVFYPPMRPRDRACLQPWIVKP